MPIPKAFATYFHFATNSHFASYVHLYRPLTKRCSLVCCFEIRILRMGERQRDKKTKRGRVEERKRQKPKKPLAINSNKPFLERSACRLQHHQRKLRLRCCGFRRHLRGRTAFLCLFVSSSFCPFFLFV